VRRATAFAPATVSNVAVGFDILGFPVESVGDFVTVSIIEEPEVRVAEVVDLTGTLEESDIPADPARNTATVGLLKLREDLRLGYGFEVGLRKGIAVGSGMGGSAASAVAALTAANALLERPLTKETLFEYALLCEQASSGTAHPDNAAPCIFGGFTLIASMKPFRRVRLPVPEGVVVVLVRPRCRVETRRARGMLKAEVPLASHVRQSALLAGFVAGCYTNDLELVRQSFRDVLIEPQRAPLIPAFTEVRAAALEEGAIGASISGSGPAVFAWTTSNETAERVRAAMVSAFDEHGRVQADSWVSPVGAEGAKVVE
jgi:homoserine kinase